MSHVHRLRTTDRIFFVTVNLRRSVKFLSEPEYPLLTEALAGARRRLGFLLYGFVRHAREFNERLVYMHLNPVRKGLVNKPEDWRWSSCNNFSLDRATVEGCPIRIDYVQLPEDYRG